MMGHLKKPKVVHLIDDTTAGGVMRVLDHLTGSPDLAQDADHTSVNKIDPCRA